MTTFFTAKDAHINQLSPEQCVELFGGLLRADARKIKLPITRINITNKTNVPDGGIDASVEGELSEKGNLIIDSRSFYQIKAGTTFAPWTESEIKKELLGDKDPKIENLGEHVRYCFENNGTYIIVCMKVQLTPEQKKNAEENIKKILKDCGIQKPNVEVWGQDKILGCLEVSPSLSLRVTGRDRAIFQSHKDWGTEEEMQRSLVLGDKQNEFIRAIRTALYDDSQSIHVNVHGETGVGKTRLIFEATNEPFLSSLVIYCNSPRNFLDSPLMTEIVRTDDLPVILVIDDCDLGNRTAIWNRLKNLGPRIKLITIHNEYDRTQGTTKQLPAPNLDEDKIKEIILQYYDDNIIAGQLSKLCGGIPRLAHVVGWDAKNNPGELLNGIPDTFDIYGRYIRYGDEPESEQVKQRTRILLTISLFKKFGYGKYFQDEMNAVHKLVLKLDSNISLSIFKENIEKLKKRSILQGEETLYVTPKGLHLWLWMKWWKDYGESIGFEEIVNELPNSLIDWFFEMFEYAANSEVAKSVVQKLFSESGPLHDSEILKTERGSRLFHALSMADPHSATDYLEKTVGQWTKQELQNFVTGRRFTIYGLERIIFEPDLFTRGGRMLRSLAEAENEEWSNNATGIFCGMFSLGPGYVSMTKTPPSERMPLLKETLCDQSETRRNLGLKACSSALQATYFTRSSGLSDNELRLDQKGWEPKTRKQWQEAYQEVIELLYEKIKTFPKNAQKNGAETIVNSSRGLLNAFPDIFDYIIDKLSKLRNFIDEETILKEIISIIEFDKDKLKPEVITKLENLQDEITGHDYPSLMNRYVKMDIMMDLARKNHEKIREEKIKELAKESLDVSKLQSQLDWLVTYDAKYSYKFGYELSSLDENRTLFPAILEAQRKSGERGSGFFASGYLLKIFETDKEKWNSIMREISKDEKLLRFFGELSWRSGITDEIGILLLDLIKENKLTINELSSFVLGGVVNKLSIEVVVQWIKLMLQQGEQKIIFNALALFNSFFIHRQKKTLDAELTLQLLMHDALFGKDYPPSFDTMVDYYWKEIALELIEQYPEKSLELCKKMLENMGERGTIIRTHSQAMEVIDKIAFKFPNETWNMATRYIDLPFDERGFAIVNWMRGGMFESSNSFLELVDYRKIFDWIDHDPHRRASYITNYAPPYLRKDNCLVRELLKKYGDDETVQRSLLANFSTGFFSGSGSQHYQAIKEKMLAYKESEDNENVKRWIDFYVKVLDEDIKREKIREEREF